MPFSARFEQVDDFGKIIFTVSLLGVAAATVLFLAPTAYHRLAPRRDRPGRLRFGVRTTLVGMFLLALSVACAIFVVVRFMFVSSTLGAVVAASVAVLTIAMWCILPIRRRRRIGEF